MVPSCSISDGWLCRPRFPPLASGGILSRRSGARRLPSHVSRTPRISCNVARARPLARLCCKAACVKAGDRPAHRGGWPSTIVHNRGGSSACFVPRPWGKSKDSSQPGDPNVTFRPHVDKDRNVEPNEIVVGMGWDGTRGDEAHRCSAQSATTVWQDETHRPDVVLQCSLVHTRGGVVRTEDTADGNRVDRVGRRRNRPPRRPRQVLRASFPTYRCGERSSHVSETIAFARIFYLGCNNPSTTNLQRGAHASCANLRFRADGSDETATEDSRPSGERQPGVSRKRNVCSLSTFDSLSSSCPASSVHVKPSNRGFLRRHVLTNVDRTAWNRNPPRFLERWYGHQRLRRLVGRSEPGEDLLNPLYRTKMRPQSVRQGRPQGASEIRNRITQTRGNRGRIEMEGSKQWRHLLRFHEDRCHDLQPRV